MHFGERSREFIGPQLSLSPSHGRHFHTARHAPGTITGIDALGVRPRGSACERLFTRLLVVLTAVLTGMLLLLLLKMLLDALGLTGHIR